MKVGFITQLLWPRYGDFWTKLVGSAGLEVVTPPDDRVRSALTDPRLERVPGTAFKLAAAQALALGADVIVAPDLNPGEVSTRGGGQDAFIADFPGALAATLGGLPPLIAVPAALSGELEGLAVSTLLNLTHDPALVRRAWERHRSAAKPPRLPEPRWRVRPSEGGTVGVVGQPWLLSDALARRVVEGAHWVSQGQLEPAPLRAEGRRAVPGLVGTDTEVLGAARFLGRKGSVERLVMITDEDSPTDAFLLAQVQKLVYKPLAVAAVQRLGEAPQPTGRR